jgi:hypothetical protein
MNLRLLMAGIVLYWLLPCIPSPAAALDAKVYVLPEQSHGDRLGPYLSIVRDTEPQTRLEDLLNSKAFDNGIRQNRSIPNFGFLDRSIYWAQISIENPFPDRRTLYIVNHYPITDYLSLYQTLPDGSLRSETLGDMVPFENRAIAYRTPIFIVELHPGLNQIYFRMQTQNSVQFNLSLWTPRYFGQFQAEDDLFLGLILGVCFVMIFYNFFVFLNFRSPSYLYYVFYIFFLAFFTSNFHGLTQQYFFPKAAQHFLAGQGHFIIIDLIVIMAINFTRTFLEIKTRWPSYGRFLNVWQMIILLNIINGLSFDIYSRPFTLYNNLIGSIILMFGGIRIAKNFIPARVFVLAWSVALTGTCVLVLANGGTIPTTSYTNWAQPIGVTCEFILLSLALTQRVALINREKHALQIEILDAEKKRTELQQQIINEREQHIAGLDRLVADRTRDIRSILNSIHQGIFAIQNVNDQPLIQAEYSAYLCHMIQSDELSGRNPIVHVFGKFDFPDEQLSMIQNVLAAILDSSIIAFEANSATLPRETRLSSSKNEGRIYEIDWSPILNEEQIVDKVLVTLRDVTDLRRLHALADQQDLEKNLISELISGQSRFFPAIQKRAIDLLTDLQEGTASPDKRLQRLATLHTLKGEARVCGMLLLARHVHDLETVLQNTTLPDSATKFQEAVQQFKHILAEYSEVYFTKLGHKENSPLEVRAQREPLEHALLRLEQLIQSHPLVHDQHEFRLVYQALNHILGMELQAVLEKHLGSLSHLAKDLGKSSPNVIFSGDHCLIPNAFQQVLQDVFGHLFTNSMDHGIESKDERLAKGKNPAGTISVSQRKTGNDLMIRYWDDGRGLNLSKLREIALKKGLLSSADELSEPGLAQLIFTSGFSTANEVTLTSGRGVGMDAIRRLLSEINSDIDLKLRELLDPETRCYSFAFEICIRFHTQVFSDHARSA